MNSAIILAGGKGTRIKSKYPKQFLPVNSNQIILDLSINVFKNNSNIDEIILVCHSDWIEKIKNKLNGVTIVNGGETRSDSSLSGLLSCHKNCTNVLIHDAARPYIKQNLINKSLKYLEEYDAAAPIISCNDSLIETKSSNNKYLNRDEIKLIQTPQAFKYQKILSALKNKKHNCSDDLSALLEFDNNIKYLLFEGDPDNFKVTTDNELRLARALSTDGKEMGI